MVLVTREYRCMRGYSYDGSNPHIIQVRFIFTRIDYTFYYRKLMKKGVNDGRYLSADHFGNTYGA